MTFLANLTFGFPKIHAEPGEKRAFLPEFVGNIAKQGGQVLLEEGYGGPMGFSEEAYRRVGAGNVNFVNLEQVLQQEYILVLRCPNDEIIRRIKHGACLISMLHYPTRPRRVELLLEMGLQAVSLDSIKDDTGRRLVENLKAVGWNGMEVAIQVLAEHYPQFEDPQRGPLCVTLMGAGAVGVHVMQSATRYANEALRKRLYHDGVPGVMVRTIDYDLTGHAEIMRTILSETDILVDATQRPDPSKPVIKNDWLQHLPEHAVLLDLSVDPYNCDLEPVLVKGIEGIPQGNLDQYIFSPDDPAYERIPPCVDSTVRRWAVSCYSWPGIYPVECMQLYGRQLRPIINRIIDAGGISSISPAGRYFERAIARATLSNWLAGLGHQ